MDRRRLWAALFVITSLGRVASADFGGLTLAGRVGSLGLGGERPGDFLPDIDDRFGVTFLPLHIDGAMGGVNYDFDLGGLTFPLTLDWYPFHGGLHVSGGLIFNQTDGGDLDTRSSAALTIGGHTYSADRLGTVHGAVRFHRLAPYLGIGWGNVFGKEGRWGILSDLGVAFFGRPSVVLSTTGPIASDAKFMRDLAQEEKDVEDDLSILRFYPVFSVNLFYRF